MTLRSGSGSSSGFFFLFFVLFFFSCCCSSASASEEGAPTTTPDADSLWREVGRVVPAREWDVNGAGDSRLRGFAYVNAGSGLKATLLRGAMNTALLAAGFNGKVFTSVDDALGWIAALPGQPAEVARAVPEVRRVVDELERTRG